MCHNTHELWIEGDNLQSRAFNLTCLLSSQVEPISSAVRYREYAHTFYPFYQHGLTLIPTWISNYTHREVWNDIAYPFPNFNGYTVEVWKWISNFIPHFIMDAITYPCVFVLLFFVVVLYQRILPLCFMITSRAPKPSLPVTQPRRVWQINRINLFRTYNIATTKKHKTPCAYFMLFSVFMCCRKPVTVCTSLNLFKTMVNLFIGIFISKWVVKYNLTQCDCLLGLLLLP